MKKNLLIFIVEKAITQFFLQRKIYGFSGTKLLIVLSLVFSVFFSGCSQEYFVPPFVISVPEYSCSTNDDNLTIPVITFSLRNMGGVSINSFTISCFVFDSVSNLSPWIGNNNITSTFTGVIEPGEKKVFEIQLGDKFYQEEIPICIVDYFYVKEITYENGQSWNDYFGIYTQGEYKYE